MNRWESQSYKVCCNSLQQTFCTIDREKNSYAAIGNSGNVIYVNPEKEIVEAVASYFKPTVFDRVDFIREHIEPFVLSQK